MSPQIRSRVEAAKFALRSFHWAKGEDVTLDDRSIIEILTALRYFCDEAEIDFDECDGIANAMYLIEY